MRETQCSKGRKEKKKNGQRARETKKMRISKPRECGYVQKSEREVRIERWRKGHKVEREIGNVSWNR